MSKDKSLGEFIKDSRQRDKEAMQRLEVATQRLETQGRNSIVLVLFVLALVVLAYLVWALAPLFLG